VHALTVRRARGYCHAFAHTICTYLRRACASAERYWGARA
jgi:hypothetical protein